MDAMGSGMIATDGFMARGMRTCGRGIGSDCLRSRLQPPPTMNARGAHGDAL